MLRDVFSFIKEHLPNDPQFIPPPKLFTEMTVKELISVVNLTGLSKKAIGFSEKKDYVELLQSHFNGNHV